MTNLHLIIIVATLIGVVAVIIISTLTRENKTIKSLRGELTDATNEIARLKKEIAEDNLELVHVQYGVSESDQMKYKSEKTMESAIKNKLTMLIANDIVSKFGAPTLLDGVYEYVFKVRRIC